ncbi:HEAT repeat domain-containing protein [Calothrix sp. PCC 7507]|uniref:HEAT repeat domain-containing protein n=1 Tax=Calothrix sp. PCC 7507 TaxID=99598 RepID=UPI00029F3BF0|nr:HEAT repeat domain-containing protein [Calothrix sp. PCC 7507]AFY30529.1 heat repeat-containing PBS lyase [Calothrix sp. PCC 7507]
MARTSYGPEVKRRSRRLLGALLVYANDETDCRDESVLASLRPQILTRWQSEHRLVVRTKVRFLEALTGLASDESQLNAQQIKEALQRFSDFLEILEDNRPSRSGSETWHFTLKLWHKRQNIAANLQQFDIEWEHRRPEKSKQVTGDTKKEVGEQPFDFAQDKGAGSKGEDLQVLPNNGKRDRLSSHHLPNWQQLCRSNLETQNHRRLTTNPLTSADGVTFELDQVYIPLGLVERKQRLRHRGDVTPQEGSRLYEPEDAEFTPTFDHNQFIQHCAQQKTSQRIAIIGEPGAGKTTLLQKVAAWILDNTEDLPIWVSLADLQGKTLEQYLIQDWLPSATRKLRVPPEIEEAFCEQFNQGRVWLLLDAVDEMAIESSHALAKIASFLKGWVADSTIILTCRLNVWDGGKNALESFNVYRNLNFTYSHELSPHSNKVEQFIQRWFQDNPTCGDSLRTELNQPERRRLKDAVKNPLRLALLCRIWGLGQGGLPNTKAMLYEQFVQSIYEWKHDRFPTTPAQRQRLNHGLGELALLAIAQEKTKFRLRHRFICEVLGTADDGLFSLALQLGWLNQVGISETQGEKVYAFYHPTFQEYFAAQAVTDWRFFLNHTLGSRDWGLGTRDWGLGSSGKFPDYPIPNPWALSEVEVQSPIPSYRIFESQWREVILLWLGREDIPRADKEEFMQALIEFSDGCGGCYHYQAYFLAAQGIAEFADCLKADDIVQQLIKWRFGYFHEKKQKWWRYPPPIIEGARVALLKTDRPKAIAALEQFIQSNRNVFDSWNAAYSLGKVFDPGNKIAIAALETLAATVRHETIRWQAAYNLGRVDPGNQTAITALVEIIATTKNESTRRKAAYSLGKLDFENAIAISTLEQIAASATDISQRRQATENLKALRSPEPLDLSKPSPSSPLPSSSPARLSSLVRGITSCEDEDTRRRKAYKLAQLDPGNQMAFNTLLQLLKSSNSESVRKRTADNLKEILLDAQMPVVIASLKNYFDDGICEHELEQFRECYKLIWHCAGTMKYEEFYQIWHYSSS